MALKLFYPTKEDIPSGFDSLYTEKDGKFVLTGIEGMKTIDDVNRVNSSLELERKQHSETKKKWEAVTGLGVGPEEVVKRLEEHEDLKAKVEAGMGKEFDENKFNEAVEKRVERERGKWDREKKGLVERVEKAEGSVGNLQGEINRSKIVQSITSLAPEVGLESVALPDALLLAERVMMVDENGQVVTKDQVGFTPGLSPKEFLEDRKQDRTHWFKGSVGGGSKTNHGNSGGGVKTNPFDPKTRNLDAQGKLFKENPAEAERLATEAGVKLHR